MELYSSSRLEKSKFTISFNKTSSKRPLSFLNSKPFQSPYTLTLPKSPKSFTHKTGCSLSPLKKPASYRTVLSSLTSDKPHQLKSLKLEISNLKEQLSMLTEELATLKANHIQAIKDLQLEKSSIISEYYKIIEFILKNDEINFKVKQDLNSLINVCGERSERERGTEKNKEGGAVMNPFKLSEGFEGEVKTARFQSFNDSQFMEILKPVGEGIVLEDFQEESDGGLNVRAGDRVMLLQNVNQSWCVVSLGFNIGRVPSEIILID